MQGQRNWPVCVWTLSLVAAGEAPWKDHLAFSWPSSNYSPPPGSPLAGAMWSLLVSLSLCSSCHLPMRLGPTGLSPTSTLLSPISLLVQLEDPSRKSFGSPLPPAPSLPLGPCWCLQYGGVHAFPCLLQTGDSSRWS